MTSWLLPAAAEWVSRAPGRALGASRHLRDSIGAESRPFLDFTGSVTTLHAASLVGNALAFRWIDPASMGVWHTLLLAASYLTVVRLGVVNGLGRELPFALGIGDVAGARRLAATALAWSTISSVVVGTALLAPLAWLSGDTWRRGLCAMAIVSATNLYFAHLQSTFRSDSDFVRLARVHRLQAASALLMPVAVYTLGFTGLCLHAVFQSLLVTAYAHTMRPLRVSPRFEAPVARELMITGLPLFAASYLQVLAAGFDRLILLRRGGVETVGYYAPAVAALAALAVVPGAIATYAYPRMSYALGQGHTRAVLGRMALGAAALSAAATVPLAAAGWLAAPGLIERLFPLYSASVPAVRWALVAGVFWGLAPLTTLLSSLKAWPSLALYIGVLVGARWTLPWLLSARYDPLVGVACGNACAAALVGTLSVLLVLRVMRGPEREVTA